MDSASSTTVPSQRQLSDQARAEPMRTAATLSPWRLAWRRFRRSTNGMIGLAIVSIIFFIAFITPLIDPYDPLTDSDMALSRKPPSLEHPFGNDFITVIGLQMGGLLGGAILTETAFSWTGMGSWFYGAITGRDYPILQTAIMLNAIIFVSMTLLVDISYAVIDPRIRYS